MANLTDIRSNWSTGASEGGVTVYATKENLPTTGLTSGDQAYVTNTSRLYISNGSGWYNVALINATPTLTISPSGEIELSTEGTNTVITLTATDSDNAVAGLTFSVDSDGSFGGLGTISQDSSVFTITPLSEDSATTTSSTLTFKASDGISFGSGTSVLSLTFKVVNSNYTTLLLQADSDGTDNQVDASNNAFTVTEYGNVTSASFTPYHPGGYSTYFDGTSNSTIQIKGEASLAIGTSDFSISFWYKGDLASNNVAASSVATGSTTQLYWNISVRSDGAVWLQTRSTANSGLQKWGKSAAGRVTANKWHHITVSRQNGWHYVAIDGVQDTSAYRDQATFNLTAQELAIGLSNITGYQSYGKGYIRDFNFCVGGSEYDLSVGDGNVAYTVPDEPITPHANTKFLLSGLPYIVDASASPLTIDVIGSTITILRDGPYDYEPYTKANHGGSVYFDGTGDYIQTPNGTYMDYGSDDFTFECWIYPLASNGDRYIVSDYTSAGQMAYASFHVLLDDGILKSYIRVGGVNVIGGLDGTTTIKLNVWHHVALVRNGNVFTLYLNGASEASTTQSGAMNVSTQPFTIGRAGNYVGLYTQGYIADARLVKGTAVYTSAFTPPTAPLTAITNTEVLTCTNKNDIWDAGQGTRLLKTGDVTASNTQRKFTTSSSIAFDGVQDAIEVTPGYDDPFYKLGTVDFTIEMWAYWTNLTGDRTLGGLIKYNSAGGRNVPYFYTSNTTLYYWTDGSNRITGSSALTLNTWHHIALTRSGNDHKLFVDGTQAGSTWTNAANYVQGRPTWGNYYSSLNTLFNGGNNMFSGYLQSLRITKGLARYTANFTPPTSQFSG